MPWAARCRTAWEIRIQQHGFIVNSPVRAATDILLPGMSRIGFGCGDLFAGSASAASARLVETALDSGIRYFDAARMYGNGSAEVVLGRILPRVRDQVIIASKAGILPWAMRRRARLAAAAMKAVRMTGPLSRAVVPAPAPSAPQFGAFSLRQLTRSVDCSLKALRTDYIDLLLLHECAVADALREDVRSFLERLRARGRIRSFGIATHFGTTMEILNAAPQVAPVAQFASDALNRHVAALPPGRPEMVVTHSSVKHVLPLLMSHLAADQSIAAHWAEATGVAPDDRSAIGELLLSAALADNASGVVLFSSTRPERVARAAAITPLDDRRAVALRATLARMNGNSKPQE